ncbi:hypothetical protein K466DRAFT_607129 [Polyporus arcularius HHB13444]|uniref:Retrotransposon gag domain-containing protein n=1 Tax=Polyporus arcularius HHB13444 TaxID=1314778 RepID=A0A5C3NMS0_9APHY|nr:hypothetical protein K466DRAFT_607129 [Polyporus arcularius HHB13444]
MGMQLDAATQAWIQGLVNTALQTIQPAQPAVAAAVTMAPRGKEPSTFDGDHEEYEAWKSEMQAYLVGVTNKDTYITVVLSFCRGNRRINDWKMAFRRAKFNATQNSWDFASIAAFWTAMDSAHQDKNAQAKAIRDLEKLTWDKHPNARDFFQAWEDLCDKAGHTDRNHEVLLSRLKRAAKADYVQAIYNSDTAIPTTYDQWKTRIGNLDRYHEQYEAEVKGPAHRAYIPKADPFKPSTMPHRVLPPGTTRDPTGVTYGGRGQAMELDRKCFKCKRKKSEPAPGCTNTWHFGNRKGVQRRRLFEDEDQEVRQTFFENVRLLAEEDPGAFTEYGLLTDEVHFLVGTSASHTEAPEISIPPDRFPPDIPR